MKRVLILGGTGWLGREIAAAAVCEGHEVVCLARGVSGDVPDGARLVVADRQMPGAYDALTGEWDEVCEIVYEPDAVRLAVDALADRAAHWTLISSVSVYASNDEPGADESAQVVEPADETAYADAKVIAERVTAERLGERLLIVRPGLIMGPGDPSDRLGYWPARFSRGGRVVIPETRDRWVQAIDVRDLAAWVVRAGTLGATGIVNAVGEAMPLARFFEAVAEVTDFHGECVAVDDEELMKDGVEYWAGPHSLPLWLPLSEAGFMRRSGEAFLDCADRVGRACAAVRPMEESLRSILANEVSRGVTRPRRAGLTEDEERRVLELARG